jgi:hypothetical protein
MAQADYAQTGVLDRGDDGADGIVCHRVGFDDCEGAFKGHGNS